MDASNKRMLYFSIFSRILGGTGMGLAMVGILLGFIRGYIIYHNDGGSYFIPGPPDGGHHKQHLLTMLYKFILIDIAFGIVSLQNASLGYQLQEAIEQADEELIDDNWNLLLIFFAFYILLILILFSCLFNKMV